MNEVARHGDMVIMKVSNTPKIDGKRSKGFKIGLGEVTGHSHDVVEMLGSELIVNVDDDVLINDELAEEDVIAFSVKGKVVVLHEEHDPIVLGEGEYLRTVHMVYDPFEKKLVKCRD